MFYVGLDIHSKHISICALNETGQVVHRSKVRSVDQMMQVLEGLTDRFQVCYEASFGWQISVGDTSQTEGGNMMFVVRLDRVASGPVTLNYSTANGTAVSPDDYTFTSGGITFAPGETHRNVFIPVVPDSLYEANETFFLNLSSSSNNAAIADGQGIGTIINTNQAPNLTAISTMCCARWRCGSWSRIQVNCG